MADNQSVKASPKRLALLLAGLVLAEASVHAAPQPPALPGDRSLDQAAECADLRAAAWDSFLTAAPTTALAGKPLSLENAYGSWRREAIRSGDSLYLLFTPRREGGYPRYSQGSWIIRRNLESGQFTQAKVFLRSDPGTFIRIYPAKERSRLDLVVYGAVLRKEIALPFSFERALRLPLAEILAACADSVDWTLFSPRPGLYADMRALAEGIRRRLPELRYADDGALDARGMPVFIATGAPQTRDPGLNCSGFAKWVIDGLYRPLTGQWLPIGELSERGIGLRGSSLTAAREESHDPFFGLDWTRNLARALGEANQGRRVTETAAGTRSTAAGTGSPATAQPMSLQADVSISPFSLLAPEADPVNGGSNYAPYPAYELNVGYEIRGLKPLLYLLAATEPGYFYLGSVNRLDQSGLRRHDHVALFLPYLDQGGEFRVAVFESATETGLENFIARQPRDFIHLVRVKAGHRFEPAALSIDTATPPNP